ncbi:MAG: phospholipid carrier-dependent glycosyltransferase [Planctomycetota bacterium]
MTTAGSILKPRSVRRDLIAISALCAVVYALGLTTHGLTNWQEAQRVLVARDMQGAGEWIVPTVHGQPYLAKPPAIYWAQMAIAGVTNRVVSVFDLRLTVALGGWLGVILTYLAARQLLRPARDEPDEAHAFADHAAWWSALLLATGVLYVRSSRIGELDILLVAPTVLAVWGLFLAWRRHINERRTHWLGLVMGGVGVALGMLVKGPPSLLVVMLAAFGAMTAWYARSDGRSPCPKRFGVFAAVAAIAAGAGGWTIRRPVESADEWFGLGCFGLAAGIIVFVMAPGFAPRAFADTFRAWTRTHPVGMPIIGVGALWLWSRAVTARIGPEAVDAAAAREAGDNLRLLVLGSPLNNLEAAAFGVGAGSVAAIIAAVWLLRDGRDVIRRHGPGLVVVLCWAGLGLIAFSALGKGVPRYLTPLWPALAMLGGLWLTSFIRDIPRPKLTQTLALAIVLALGLGQAIWYGFARERLYAERSPRAFATDLMRAERRIDPDRLGMLDHWSPALDFYAGQHVERWHDTGPHAAPPGVVTRPLAELPTLAADATNAYTLLYPRDVALDDATDPVRDQLMAMGLGVQRVPMDAAWTVEHGRLEIIAVRVWTVQP